MSWAPFAGEAAITPPETDTVFGALRSWPSNTRTLLMLNDWLSEGESIERGASWLLIMRREDP